MIRKLKFKFIATNMLLICAVLITAFMLIYRNTAYELKTESINAIKDIAHRKPDMLGNLFDKNNKYSGFTTYTLEIDERFNKCYIEGFGEADNLTEENVIFVRLLIDSVHSIGTEVGLLEEQNMRFYVTEAPFGERIVLIDKSYEDERLKSLMISFTIGGIITFVFILVISAYVAKIAIKPVEKSIQTQKQLISDLSHELKTPIAVITTNTELIMSHEDSSIKDEIKWLSHIKDESKRMGDLVSDMLFLAKEDESENKAVLSEIDLSTIAYEACLPLESICFENNKIFSYNIENNVYIKANPNLIKQLLVILLDNAIKYSNINGTIDLSIYKESDRGIIKVFNTGEPIPKESIPRIFDRFYRVDKARSRESGGNGLGLSIAKSIIDSNEGTISVTSNENYGTIFTCSFKLIKNSGNTSESNQIS